MDKLSLKCFVLKKETANNSSSKRKTVTQFKSLRCQELFADSVFTDLTSMEMWKKHYSISLSLVDNHITVMAIVNVAATNCGTGLDVERLKGNLTCSLSNLDSFAVNE